MKKIKVLLQYPWKFPDSSYYKNILDFPPKRVTYVNYDKQTTSSMDVIGSSKRFEAMRKFKNVIRRIIALIKIPNLTMSFRNDYDVIHCAHCLSLNRKPWVVDTEVYDRLSAAGGTVADKGLGKWIIKKRLESPSCKKIIAWSQDCKQTIIDAFPDNKKILDKIVLLPFALPAPTLQKRPHTGINILFVARWFDAKGGRQTLEVFDRLSKKYPKVNCTFICPTPQAFKERYQKNAQIIIRDLMSQDKIFKEFYSTADIFFYPGFGDSYGFAVPEALAHGIPVVTTKTFAKSELVKDGETGLLVDVPKGWDTDEDRYRRMDEPFIKDLCSKTEQLIINQVLREKMSRQAQKEAQTGLFSLNKRNASLVQIYTDALTT